MIWNRFSSVALCHGVVLLKSRSVYRAIRGGDERVENVWNISSSSPELAITFFFPMPACITSDLKSRYEESSQLQGMYP